MSQFLTPTMTPTMPPVMMGQYPNSDINLIAEYGRTKSYFSSILGCCILLCIILCGGFIIKSALSSSKTRKKIIGTVTNSVAIGSNNYNISVKYNINNTDYNNIIISNKPQYVGSPIDIYYDIKNPNNINVDSPKKVILSGTMLIVCALCFCLLITYNLYNVTKYEHAAVEAAYSGSKRHTYLPIRIN
jgi:hypothetical protein